VRATMGGGRSSGAQHSQSWHAWFAHVPGLKVVVPSTPYDAKGLLKTALREPNPVIFFEDKVMYAKVKGPVPEEEYCIPFGKADIKRAGKDVTLIALSRMIHPTLAAAEKLAAEGIEAEVVDPRTLTPLDEATLIESVKKTGSAVIVDEGYQHFGATAELAAVVAYGAFDYLDAPVERLGAMDVPIPFTPVLENATIPDESKIIAAVHRVLEGRRGA
jgi:pyruvate/2-oxoglutarate/acetoin dehydrogenase E1 component